MPGAVEPQCLENIFLGNVALSYN